MKKLILIMIASLFVVASVFADEPASNTQAVQPNQPTPAVQPTPAAPTPAPKTAKKAHKKVKKVVSGQAAPAQTQGANNTQPAPGATTAQTN